MGSDIKAAFKRFDADGDGQITKNGMRCSDSELDVIYALGDLDGDGEISVGEFIRVMSPPLQRLCRDSGTPLPALRMSSQPSVSSTPTTTVPSTRRSLLMA